jgi:hypothetical protein
MLVDRYEPEAVFARVPEVAQQTNPVLKRLDQLLEDDQLYQQVRADQRRQDREHAHGKQEHLDGRRCAICRQDPAQRRH